MQKIKVAILGATGMVGQNFINLLVKHSWFEIGFLAASDRSSGKTLKEAVKNKNFLKNVPDSILNKIILNIEKDAEYIAKNTDFAFCAVDMPKEAVQELEYKYAKLECPIVSNNSAHRCTKDVPMIIPEINYKHLEIIKFQKERLNTKHGFIVTKPNCSIQTFVPALHPLKNLGLRNIILCTYQAVSGAGKTIESFSEIQDNIIPFIENEESKTEEEPLKIWGEIKGKEIISSNLPIISSQCSRVPVSHGHMATVFVKFDQNISKKDIIDKWTNFKFDFDLPSSPKNLIEYNEDLFRPQTRLDRDRGGGMTITTGRLRKDPILDYKFTCLSHNIIRGSAGGSVLLAELLVKKKYISSSSCVYR
ncbi:MAG: aspartate-semialdehyde dehydrogenase [Candidatus Improbicoccus pseudotrichonymphae]|uniref:Aspartate-semialdehyde dehydrogenase n=1 Tax=Candidatus Improbicoccus pseudotrichonymphae TaxID=3033792 RepID=A0AA48IA65_9FIRM|nr:MAG: aspartate-semialdehyde dehydrogenase [Candidatus Improbicoccus pseudotrichonymphae]